MKNMGLIPMVAAFLIAISSLTFAADLKNGKDLVNLYYGSNEDRHLATGYIVGVQNGAVGMDTKGQLCATSNLTFDARAKPIIQQIQSDQGLLRRKPAAAVLLAYVQVFC